MAYAKCEVYSALAVRPNFVLFVSSLAVGTDESLLAKFNKHHSLNNCYEKPPTKEPCFSIIHYAGAVKYNIKVIILRNL